LIHFIILGIILIPFIINISTDHQHLDYEVFPVEVYT
jgi:hypothetical protein